MDILIAIRISITSYCDKSWYTPNKFSATFFFIITVQNMASEVELEALNSINTSKLKKYKRLLSSFNIGVYLSTK